MKLKALLLVALAAAGVGASIAVADNGRGNDHGDRHGCHGMEISGTVAPQTFTVTVTHGGRHGSVTPGSTLVVTIGGTGQTVRANVNACASSGGTGTTSTTMSTTVRAVDLRAFTTNH